MSGCFCTGSPTACGSRSGRLRLRRAALSGVQQLGLRRKVGRSCRELALVEHERQDVGHLLPTEAARCVAWHSDADALEQLSERQVVPVRIELATRQTRRHLAPGQVLAVAAGTVL